LADETKVVVLNDSWVCLHTNSEVFSIHFVFITAGYDTFPTFDIPVALSYWLFISLFSFVFNADTNIPCLTNSNKLSVRNVCRLWIFNIYFVVIYIVGHKVEMSLPSLLISNVVHLNFSFQPFMVLLQSYSRLTYFIMWYVSSNMDYLLLFMKYWIHFYYFIIFRCSVYCIPFYHVILMYFRHYGWHGFLSIKGCF